MVLEGRMKMPSSRLTKIRAFFTDVDGVLTDGRIILGARNDDEFASFDVQDGVGQKLAEAAGLPVVWLTGRMSGAVAQRAHILKPADLFRGRVDKVEAAEGWCQTKKLTLSQIAFMGDDLIDLPLLKQVGWSVAPANARPEVKAAVDYVTKASGGRGAFREAVETLLKRQGRWPTAMREYLKHNKPMV
jgi:3-deoxy-D-manno-octulosonate 8-phosphate phosphatase (KDO 8-P phosphatase)